MLHKLCTIDENSTTIEEGNPFLQLYRLNEPQEFLSINQYHLHHLSNLDLENQVSIISVL